MIISGAFSLLFHFFFIQFVLNQKKLNDNKEIFVIIDLTSYKEFSIPQTPPPIPEVIEKKEINDPVPNKIKESNEYLQEGSTSQENNVNNTNII